MSKVRSNFIRDKNKPRFLGLFIRNELKQYLFVYSILCILQYLSIQLRSLQLKLLRRLIINNLKCTNEVNQTYYISYISN